MTIDKRTIEIEVLNELSEEITYTEIVKRINETVPVEYLDNVKIETDKHGYIEVTYIRPETDEEYRKRLELEAAKQKAYNRNIMENLLTEYEVDPNIIHQILEKMK